VQHLLFFNIFILISSTFSLPLFTIVELSIKYINVIHSKDMCLFIYKEYTGIKHYNKPHWILDFKSVLSVKKEQHSVIVLSS